jgi:LEA14-like dessication related protein
MLINIAVKLTFFYFGFADICLPCLKPETLINILRPLKLSTLPLSFLLTILLISCSTPKELEYRDFRNFTIDKLGFSSSAIKMDLVYYNPNNFGLQLKTTDLDIFLDNNYLGHTIQDELVSIPRREEFAIPIKIDVDMKNLLKNGFATLMSNEVTIKVTGTVKVGKGSIFKSFPVNYEGRQKFTIF